MAARHDPRSRCIGAARGRTALVAGAPGDAASRSRLAHPLRGRQPRGSLRTDGSHRGPGQPGARGCAFACRRTPGARNGDIGMSNIVRDSDVVELTAAPFFSFGEKVRAKRTIRNDGTYAGKE